MKGVMVSILLHLGSSMLAKFVEALKILDFIRPTLKSSYKAHFALTKAMR